MKKKILYFFSVILFVVFYLSDTRQVFADSIMQEQEKHMPNDIGTLDNEDNTKITQISISNSGKVIKDNSFVEASRKTIYCHPPISDHFKTYDEFLAKASDLKDYLNNTLNPNSISDLRVKVLTEMNKKINESRLLPNKVGEVVAFKWSDMKVNTSSGNIAYKYESGFYNIQDLRESYLYAFGSSDYPIYEEAYNDDNSIKLICKTSSEDPLGVDIFLTILKKQAEYSTKFTFKAPECFYNIIFFQRVFAIWSVKNYDGKFLLKGNSISFDFSPFIKPSVKKVLTAEPVSQITSLVSDTSKFDYSKFVTNVKLGDQLLSSDQYKVELINSLATDTIGTKNAKIRVTLKSDTSKAVEVDVPVEVGWGNSIVYGSYDYGANGRTSAAFTLYTESTPTIVASQGQNDDNLAIHSNFPNQQYYTFNWFNLSNKQILKIDESNNGDKYIKASGNELKKDKLKEWGTAQNQAVNYGDIVRAWQIETGKNWLYENEQKQAYNDDKKSVYYEITTSGYRPLHFNQLTPKTGKIPIYSTNQYLDEHVTDYIDLKGYSNITVKGFTEYPGTTSSGDKRAKILVEETLTTGKKVQYEYEVTINVEPGTLTYTVPKTLTFKEFSKSKSEQIVQRKYSGSLGLLIKDNRGSNNQGNWILTAKASSDLKGIAPYLIYRNEKGDDSYLNGSAVPVYTQDKQVSATEPLEVEVSSKWKSTDGILLKIPSKNNLASQEYSTTVTWNLVEGP